VVAELTHPSPAHAKELHAKIELDHGGMAAPAGHWISTGSPMIAKQSSQPGVTCSLYICMLNMVDIMSSSPTPPRPTLSL
jgi:hypothetical protein